jgi:hypothetical protein
MVWLGRVSHSVYILHFTAIGFINPAMAGFSPFIIFPIRRGFDGGGKPDLSRHRTALHGAGRTAWEKTRSRGSAMLPATEGSRGG